MRSAPLQANSLASLQVGIVGGGIAGVAAALILGQAGAQVTVFEQVAKPAALGAGILLQPTGLAVLQKIDPQIELDLHGSQIVQLLGHNPQGRVVLDSQYRHWQAGSYGLGICRGALFDALWQRVRQLPNVQLKVATPIVRITPQANHTVIASEQEEYAFDLVIVAEGVHSRLREQLSIPCSVKPYPWGAYWAIVDLPEGWTDSVLLQRYRAARQMAGVLPMGRNPHTHRTQASVFWSMPCEHLRASPDVQSLHQSIEALWPDLRSMLGQISHASQWTPARYADVVLPHWHCQRTVLIGDAAHAMSPQLGQGATMGLLDAYMLTRALQAQPNIVDALEGYSQQRKNHIRYYQWASRWLTPLFQSDRVLAPWLRDRFLTKSNALPWMRRFNVETLVGVKTGWFRDSLDLADL